MTESAGRRGTCIVKMESVTKLAAILSSLTPIALPSLLGVG